MKEVKIEKDSLNELYSNPNLTLKDIANYFNVSSATIINKLNKYKIKRRLNNVFENKKLGLKKCNSCLNTLPLESFYQQKNRKGVYRYRSDCKKCHNQKTILFNKIHKDKRRPVQSRYWKKRKKEDPSFKLRMAVSSSINRTLFHTKGKKESSVWKKLPYSPQELRLHLEKQFEPWMNWENHGNHDPNRKTWQMDHITAQRDLLYDSLDHPNFLKCWGLDNLRPLEAKENLLRYLNNQNNNAK